MYFPASGKEADYGAADLSDLSEDGGTVSFTKSFRYLGSIITWHLGDGEDVEARIRAAAQSFGALRDSGFVPPQIPLRTKAIIYQAVVHILLLYGCECWAVTADMARRLKTFHNRCVRTMCRVPSS